MADVLYTPDLANAALPLVRAIVSDVVELETEIAELTGSYVSLKGDPAKPQVELNRIGTRIGELVEHRDDCEEELEALGVRLGDAARGICDFPAEIDGDPIYLCWELGEERVEFFHPRDAGFAGRRPLPVPVAAG